MSSRFEHDQIIEAAYAMHAGRLLRGLTVLTRDPAVAEDITQEAFMRFVVEVRAGRTPDAVGAWLYRVGHNIAMSRGRHLAVSQRHAADTVPRDAVPSPEALTIEAERHRGLRDALVELGPVDQQALIMSANGFNGAEIARSIGRSEGATRTLLCRARTKVRGRMLAAGTG
jgi:RNA polymerase sigma factor (sigma-70 family)